MIGGGCALLLAQACGGRSDTRDYLFGPDGTIVEAGSSSTAGQAAGGNTAVGGTRTTGGTRSDGGSGVTTGGVGTVGGATVTGGTGPIGGSIGVAGTGTVGGTGVGGTGVGGTIGAAGAPNGPTITCGTSHCDASTQQCCGFGAGGFKCLAAGAACDGASLGCTLPSDCPGNQVCCISLTGDLSDASSCKASCDRMGPARDRQLCETDDDCQPPFRFCTATVFQLKICTRNP